MANTWDTKVESCPKELILQIPLWILASIKIELDWLYLAEFSKLNQN